MRRVLLIPTIVLLLIGLSCFALTARKLPSNPAEKPIVLCIADDIQTLDPGRMSWMNDIRVATALWEGLTAYDPETFAPVPGVAESWEISPDGRTYTFHLRKEAKWSNGDPVTAGDFLFAWKRILIPATGAEYIGLFKGVVGAEDFTKSLGDKKDADFSTVGLKAPDPHTLVVSLNAPCTYFLDLCAFAPLFPLHEKSMRPFLIDLKKPEAGYNGRWSRPPYVITNGPYILHEWKFKQYVSLKPNPQYWDKKNVRCPNVIVQSITDPRTQLVAYQDKTVDVLTQVPPQLGEDLLAQRDAGLRHDIHYGPVFGSYYFAFNCKRKPYDDARVRKALSLAIDKKKIIDEVTRMKQRPLGVIVPPDSVPGYTSPAGLPMDLPLAKKLLAEAGFPDGKGMPSVQVLYNTDAATHGMVAQAIDQMWQQNLGVTCTFRAVERAGFNVERRRNHNFDVTRAGWYGDYVDPTTWLDLLRTGDGNNDGEYSNPAYDALLDKAAMEANPETRFKILQSAEAMLVHEEFPLIPLYQYGDGLIFDDTKIEGIHANVRTLTPLKWIRRK